MKIHVVKSRPYLFKEIINGNKKHEMRNNDRNYKIGDILHIKECDHLTGIYSGREQFAKVTYITDSENYCALSDVALNPNYAVLSIELIEPIQ